MGLFVQVLGPLEARRDGSAVPIGGPKARLTLAVLLGHRGSAVSVDRLVDALWGDDPPPSAVATVQSNVSRLRKALSPEVEILTRGPGYVLEMPAECLDAARFEELTGAADAATPGVAIDLLETALAMWRGHAFDEFADFDWARGAVARLEELRLVAQENLIDARLALGDVAAVVGELERLVVDHPLREQFWRQLMLALYRSGRQAEALRRANELREFLGETLGLDLSPAARDLEQRIFADDPSLLGTEPEPSASRRARAPLPVTEATRFVGRDDDLEAVAQLLGTGRLVTLVGPGGVGKTRLAMRLAATAPVAGATAPYVAELAGTRDPRAVVQAIAAALDVQQRQHLSLEGTLFDFLRSRTALIVLDNCEHVVDTLAPFVDQLRGACPGITVLATSREPLGLAGELTWQLRPLTVPGPDDRTPESVGASEAAQLFVDRASAARPGFVLTAENAAAVAEICRRLDGLPLALELAAARLRSMGPFALAERLGNRAQLLGVAQRGADRRHRTLRDTLEWSYDLLTPAQQLLFVRLATFVGSFDLAAVEQLCAIDGESAFVADELGNLVDKSMVQVVDLDEPRYRLLQTLREFGLEHLDLRDERAGLRARHVAWYAELAHDAAIGLTGADEAVWAGRLDRDFENCREAHASAVLGGDLDAAVGIVASLREYAFRRMRYEVTTWAETTRGMPDFEHHRGAPVVIAVAAYGAFVRGDLDTALELGQHAQTTAERLGTDTAGLAERTLGNALFFQGRTQAALEQTDAMVAHARATGSPARLAHALYMRSVAATTVGDPELGSRYAAEASRFAERCQSQTALAQAAYATGVACEASSPDEATVHLRQASELARSAGNRWVEAFAMTQVLWLDARKGNGVSALRGYVDVIDTWYRGGDWANQWLSLRHVCSIFAQLGANRPAAVLHGAIAAAGAAAALPFEPFDAELLGERIENVRRLLGPAEFAAAVHDGASTRDATIVRYVQDQILQLTSAAAV